MKKPRLNILRTFEAAGRRLSFSLAAAELNISQAAVSQQMRHLEAYLDTPLFIRHHRRLSLTSTGAQYLNAVHEALDRLDTITDQLFPDRSEQLVTLRCSSSVATLWLAPKLGSFHKRHPQIDLRIRTMDYDIQDRVSSGSELEIVIIAEESTSTKSHKLLEVKIIPVCSPDMLKSRARPMRPADLQAIELIHIVGYKDDWHKWFRTHQSQEVTVPGGLSVDSSMFAIEAALRGDGIMLGRRPFIDNYLASGELVEVFDSPLHLHAVYCLQQNSKGRSSNATQTVSEWLREVANKTAAQISS